VHQDSGWHNEAKAVATELEGACVQAWHFCGYHVLRCHPLAVSRTKWFLFLSSLVPWRCVFGPIFGAINARVPGLMLGMSSSWQQPEASYSLKTSMLQSSKS